MCVPAYYFEYSVFAGMSSEMRKKVQNSKLGFKRFVYVLFTFNIRRDRSRFENHVRVSNICKPLIEAINILSFFKFEKACILELICVLELAVRESFLGVGIAGRGRGREAVWSLDYFGTEVDFGNWWKDA